MKIVFFGTSKFAADILETVSGQFSVVAVVTQPDKPVGRKQELTPSPVAELAKSKNIPVLKPEFLKNETIQAEIKSFNPDLFVVIAYGKIIPQAVLDIPKHGSINIHPSLLPKYRGTSPIHAALLNDDKETGVTIMLMDADMDHGPILKQERVTVDPTELFLELEEKLLEVSKKLILDTIPAYLDGTIKPVPQNHEEASVVKIISKEDGKVDWNQPARNIFNKYRAYINWPGIWTTWNGKNLKLLTVKLSGALQGASEPGTVIQQDDAVLIQTSEGALEVIKLQLEGKNPTMSQDFVRGNKEFVGSKLL